MKKATNKLMSFLAAFAMVLSVLVAPFTTANADEENTTSATNKVTNTVTLHKILMDKATFDNWPEEGSKTGKNEEEYIGNKITNVKDFFAGENADDTAVAKEIPGVYFAVKYADDYKDEKGNTANAGKFVTIKETAGEAPVYGAVDSLDAKLEKGVKLLAGETTANGIEFNTQGLKGDFLIEEYQDRSSYKGGEGESLTDNIAVPVKITLPLINNKGTVEDAHVYPKNTEEKPQIDKNFAKGNTLEEVTENTGDFYTEEEKNLGDQTGDITEGPNYDNYQKKKKIAEGELGKKIPYEVNTEIPANSKLKLAKWDDNMSAGLTYNKDLKLSIGGNAVTNTDKTTYYTIKETDSGFVLTLEEEGLKLINNQAKAVTVALAYSATVNSDAIVDMPQINDVKFNYGNNPTKATEPKSTKPNEGKITVEKTWDNGSNFEDGEWADFKLINATTGREVTADDLVQGNLTDDEFANIKNEFKSTVRLSKGTTETYTWKYLDGETEYTAIEIGSQTLSDAEYTVAEDGTIKVTNHKSTNPKPLNPTEPKVVLGGKKFVKTNEDGTERLAGAEFYVKNSDGKYLVAKDEATEEANAIDVAKLSKAYKKAFDDYNAAIKEENTTDENVSITIGEGENAKTVTGKEDIEKEISDLYDAYETAVEENASAYTWEADTTNAVVLVSDEEGRFEITGLEYADGYELEEKSAPAGYAKRSDNVNFNIKKGSYSTDDVNIKYNSGDKSDSAKQVVNLKVTIPQTGGIGSLIFIVAGLALMGVAFVAMKRRNSYEEA